MASGCGSSATGSKLDEKLVQLMDELELMTADNDLVHLTVALNYGGRDEVARATKRLVRDVEAGKLDPENRWMPKRWPDILTLMCFPIRTS